jgi:hypothetical protein
MPRNGGGIAGLRSPIRPICGGVPPDLCPMLGSGQTKIGEAYMATTQQNRDLYRTYTRKQFADYYRRELGLSTYPAYGASRRYCSCGDRNCKKKGRHPWYNDYLKHSIVSQENFDCYWQKADNANIGVRVGSVSRLLVLCVNEHVAIQAGSIFDYEKDFGKLPKTVEFSASGRRYGLRQLLFRTPEGLVLPKRTALDPGIYVKGEDDVLYVPPSLSGRGERLDWADGKAPWETPLLDAPEWLLGDVQVTNNPDMVLTEECAPDVAAP